MPRTIFYIDSYGGERDVDEKPYIVPLSVGDCFIYEGLSYRVSKVSFDIFKETLDIYSNERT